MANVNENIIVTIDRDWFRSPDISQEELCRRLTMMVESLYLMLSQIQGGNLINNNTTTYESTNIIDARTTIVNELPTGTTMIAYAFKNSAGELVELNFVEGILQ